MKELFRYEEEKREGFLPGSALFIKLPYRLLVGIRRDDVSPNTYDVYSRCAPADGSIPPPGDSSPTFKSSERGSAEKKTSIWTLHKNAKGMLGGDWGKSWWETERKTLCILVRKKSAGCLEERKNAPLLFLWEDKELHSLGFLAAPR